MNREKAQQEITKIVESYRASAGKFHRRQYPASKKYLVRAEELGILDMIPDGYGMNTPANGEIQAILQAAEDAGNWDAVMNVHGEGEEIRTTASALYQAINEDDDPELTSADVTKAADDQFRSDQGYTTSVFSDNGIWYIRRRSVVGSDDWSIRIGRKQSDLQRWLDHCEELEENWGEYLPVDDTF